MSAPAQSWWDRLSVGTKAGFIACSIGCFLFIVIYLIVQSHIGLDIEIQRLERELRIAELQRQLKEAGK